MTTGERLKKRRRDLNMSQETLAALVNVHSNTIRKWEHDTRSPDAKKLNELATALKTTVAYLLGEVENSSQKQQVDMQVNSFFSSRDNKIPNMAYWGEVADNARNVAEYGDNEDIADVAQMLKRALSSLVKLPANKNILSV